MLSLKAPPPGPSPDRLNRLISTISMLEAGPPRRRHIAKLCEILGPWSRHWAGGIADAERRIRRFKALGHSSLGQEFSKSEIEERISDAVALLPPNVAQMQN